MIGLGRTEQETIINFDKGSDTASIYTYERAWQRHLEKHLHLKPIRNDGFGGKEYELDKHLLRLPLPKRKREMTKEEKERATARLQSARVARKG